MPGIQTLYTNAFLEPKPASETSPGAGSAPDLEMDAKRETTYSPERHGSIAAFIRHPDFAVFRRWVERDIDELIDFAMGARHTREALDAWRRTLFDVDNAGRHLSYGDNASLMYGPGADCLAQLCKFLQDPRLSLQSRRSELEQLAPQLLECPQGAIEALEISVGRLNPDRSKQAGKYRHAVDRIVEQIAVEAVEHEYGHWFKEARLAQRHFVAGLKTKLHQALGLKWPLPKDPLSHDQHDDALIEQYAARLRPLIAPGAVARVLAEDYLLRFTQAYRAQAQSQSPAQLARPSRGLLEDCTAALKIEFGSTPPTTALMRERADGGGYECRSDATLVALHFLDEMRQAGCLDVGHQIDTLASWPDRGPLDEPCTSHLRTVDDLHWVETQDERRPVDVGDLTRSPELPWSAPLLESALANSAPDQLESLHAQVHPGWLLSQNILDRLIGRLGMARVEALVAQAQAQGNWDADHQAWWAQAQAARDPARPPIGLLRWSDGQVSHQLAPAHVDELLDRRANDEFSDEDLQRRLSDLLNLTFSAPPMPAPGPRQARRAMAVVAPLRQWWGSVGGSLRDEPPRLRPEELLDIITKPGGDQVVPLIRCLSPGGPHEDVIHVLFEGLSALSRDGLFSTAELMTRLGEPGLSPQGLTRRLSSLSGGGLQMLLEFAVRAVFTDSLSREACRRLFLGDVPASAEPLSPPALPLTLLRDAVASDNASPLARYLSAVAEAVQRGIVSSSDLSRILACHLALPSTAAARTNGWPSAMFTLLRQVVRFAVDGHLALDEAMRALHPGEPAPGDLPDCEWLTKAIEATCPALRLSFGRALPALPAPERQVRRELLNRLIGRSGEGSCRLLDEFREAGRDQDAIALARRIRSSMSLLEYESTEIDRVVGPSARSA